MIDYSTHGFGQIGKILSFSDVFGYYILAFWYFIYFLVFFRYNKQQSKRKRQF